MRRTTSSWLSTFAKLGFKRRRAPRRLPHRGYQRRLSAEALEDRRLLAIVVTSEFDDNGAGTTLREAVVAATPDETIQFSPTLNGKTIQLADEIVIDKPLTIQGPGDDLLTIKAINPTSAVGDGERIFNVQNTNNLSGVVTISGLTLTGGDVGPGIAYGGAIFSDATNLTLQDLTIVGNSAIEGGGVYITGTGTGTSQVIIVGCQIGGNTDPLRNVSSERGGGVFIAGIIGDSSVSITSSSIVGNIGHTAGGGLYLSSGGPGAVLGSYELRDCIVSNNEVLGNDAFTLTTTDQGDGGGIYVDLFQNSILDPDGPFIIDRCSISNNVAYTSGGGIFVNSFSDTEFLGALISNSTIDHNVAYGVDPSQDHSQMHSASGGGGIAYRDEPSWGLMTHSIVNSTISSNRALNGGGILFGAPNPSDYYYPRPVSVDVRHSTIAFNTAGPFLPNDPYYRPEPEFTPPWGLIGEPTAGGGVAIGTYSVSLGTQYYVPSFDHTIIANNSHIVLEPQWYLDAIASYTFDSEESPDVGFILMWLEASNPWPLGPLNFSYSIVGDRTGPLLEGVFDVVDAGSLFDTGNPGLDANLQQNGASPTLPDGTAVRTHALLPGSIAIDKGDPAILTGGSGTVPEYDERGPDFDRVHDSIPGGARIDIGAFELQPVPCVIYGDYNDDGTVNAADYTVWRDNLGASIALPNEDPTVTPGMVTPEDYDVWKDHFGETCEEGSASIATLVDAGVGAQDFVDSTSVRSGDSDAVSSEDAIVHWQFFNRTKHSLPGSTRPNRLPNESREHVANLLLTQLDRIGEGIKQSKYSNEQYPSFLRSSVSGQAVDEVFEALECTHANLTGMI